MKQSWMLSRRTFLRGAGVALGIPHLEAMVQADGRPLTDRPRRMFCVFFPDGVSLPPKPEQRDLYWFPSRTGRDYELSKSLSPLQPHKDDLTVIGGIEHPTSRGLQGHNAADIWLTGADIRRGYTNSISVDQVASRALAGRTRFPSLVLSTEGGTGPRTRTATMSFGLNGLPIPAQNRPRLIFERLFVSEDATSTQRARLRMRRQRSMLDAVHESAKDLRRQLGVRDRQKLDSYLDSVRSTEELIRIAEDWHDRPKPQVSDDGLALDSDVTDPVAYIRCMYDLVALAFQTDSTRVATWQIAREVDGASNRLSVSLGLPTPHAMSHKGQGPDGDYVPWAKWDHFLAEQFAYLLEKLKSTEEADGNLLDHSLVLYGSSSSTIHTALNYPTILAGGSQLGLKHGQYVRYDEKTPFGNVLFTMLDRMALPQPVESFAGSTDVLTDMI